MPPEGGVAPPLSHHQAVQAAAGHGQVEKGRVGQELKEVAKDKGGKVFQAQGVALASVISCVHNITHYLLRLSSSWFPFGSWSTTYGGVDIGVNLIDHNSWEIIDGGGLPFASFAFIRLDKHCTTLKIRDFLCIIG